MRNVLLLALAAALVAGAWFVIGSGPPPAPQVAGHARAGVERVVGSAAQAEGAQARVFEAGPALRGAALERGRTGAGGLSIRSGGRAAPELGVNEAGAPRAAVSMLANGQGREPLTFAGRLLPEGSREPVADALVTMRAGDNSSEAMSGPDGRFEIAWLSGLVGSLSIEHEGFVDLRMAELDPELLGSETEFQLTPSGSLTGVLDVPFGTSLSGAIIDVWRMVARGEKQWPRSEVSVAADGSFALLDLDPGEYAVCPRVAGVSGRYKAGIAVPVGGEAFVELKCTDGGLLVGRLVGPPGMNMPDLSGARVELLPRDVGLPKKLARERVLVAAVDAAGGFELTGIPPGAHRLRIMPAWGGMTSFKLDFDESGERLERDFEVPPPARIEGVVFGPDGRTVSGATVLCMRRKDKASLSAALVGGEAQCVSVSTDIEGRFVLDPIAAGESLVLVARGAGAPPAWHVLTALGPGESRGGIVLAMPAALELRGRIEALSATGAVGAHLAGAEVQARYQADGREFTFTSALANADGEYVLAGLIPGHMRIEARADGFLDASMSLELLAGADLGPLDLALERALEINGRIVDEAGAGIASLRVRASTIDPGLPEQKSAEGKPAGPPDRMAHSDAYGRFRFAALAEADWFLEPLGAEYERVEVSPRVVDRHFVEDGGEVELVVRRRKKLARAALEFVVVRSDTGLAPSGLEVFGAGTGSALIDGGGVELTGLAPTPIKLLLRADGCAAQYIEAQLFPGADEDLGLIQLDPGARVTVRVIKADGRVLTSAKVRLVPDNPGRGGPREGTPALRLAHIGGGRYRFDGVPYGSWKLKVTLPGAKASRQPLEISRSKLQKTVKLASKGAASVR